MVVIKYPIHGCNYKTPNHQFDIVCRLLDLHKVEHGKNSGSSKAVIMPNASQLIRLRVDQGISQETWLAFIRRWELFKTGSNISSQNANKQLFQCAHDKLGDLILANDLRLMAKLEEHVAKLMEPVAVIKVALKVKRAELMRLNQEHDEPFKTFTTRVRSKAETCNFKTVSECKCGKKNMTNYTDKAIKDVMLAGIDDDDIGKEVLSTEDILSRASFDSFIESKEMGRHATENSRTVSLVSSFQRLNK